MIESGNRGIHDEYEVSSVCASKFLIRPAAADSHGHRHNYRNYFVHLDIILL